MMPFDCLMLQIAFFLRKKYGLLCTLTGSETCHPADVTKCLSKLPNRLTLVLHSQEIRNCIF